MEDIQHYSEDKELARREQVLAMPAALAAIVAALATPVSLFIAQTSFKDAPVNNDPSQLRFIAEHGGGWIAMSSARSIGIALVAVVAYYLYIATKRRKPELPGAVAVLGIAGPLVFAVASFVQAIYLVVEAKSYSGLATQTIQRAEDILQGTASLIIAFTIFAATLALAFWLVVGSLNAMRVGLLTRAMGVVGILIGVFTVVPIGFAPAIMALWLLALAALFSGFWPGGRPPAWESGTAIPWLGTKERMEQETADEVDTDNQSVL